MTLDRPEVVVSVSNDGKVFQELEFLYKAGSPPLPLLTFFPFYSFLNYNN
jgi:hypothetical protein